MRPEKSRFSLASGTRAYRRTRTGPSHVNGLVLVRGRPFYLAIVRSGSSCCHASPQNMRTHARLREMPSFQSWRGTLRGPGHEETVSRWLSGGRTRTLDLRSLLLDCSPISCGIIDRQTFGWPGLDREEWTQSGALAIIGGGRSCQARVVESRPPCRSDLSCIDVSPRRHLKVGRVIVCNRCPDCVREGVVGPLP